MKCIMTMKGRSSVVFENKGDYTTMSIKGLPVVGMSHTDFHATYREMIASGWTAKLESPKDSEKKAEKKVAEKKGPSWDFGPEGFDYKKYIETAKTIEGATYVDPRYGIKVKKAYRTAVYIKMGAKKVR